MNAITQLNADEFRYTVTNGRYDLVRDDDQAVINAICSRIKTLNEDRHLGDLNSHTAVARAILDRFESIGAAQAFMARADETVAADEYGAYFSRNDPRSKDDRAVVFCWANERHEFLDHSARNGGYAATLVTLLLGVVVDPDGEQGNAVIIPCESCRAVFGDEMVNQWVLGRFESEREKAGV